MLDNMKIGKKLYVLVGFLVALAVTIGVAGVLGIASSNRGLERVYNDNMIPSTILAELDDAMMDSVKHLLLSSFHDSRLSESKLHEKDHPTSKHTDQIEKRMAELKTLWKKYKDSGNHGAEEMKLINAFDANLEKFTDEAIKKN